MTKKIRILFLLPVAYPTEKAYGVSVGRSAQAINTAGTPSEIWAYSDNEIDDFGNKIVNISGHKGRIRKRFSSKSPLVRVTSFISICLISARQASSKLLDSEFSEDLIVVRELVLALFLSIQKREKKLLVEIHQLPNWRTIPLVGFLQLKGGVKLSTISEFHKIAWAKWVYKKSMYVTPMGVPKEFFMTKSINPTHALRVAYVGKSSSGGHDNGIIDLIPSIKEVQKAIPSAEFTFLGIDMEFREKFLEAAQKCEIERNRIHILPHRPHADVLDFLKTQDFGLIPYPSSPYHNSRFPIKALEYAAAGLILLVRKNETRIGIIPENTAKFFNLAESHNLAKAISEVVNSDEISSSLRSSATKWAQQYTYENRAKSYINILDDGRE